jgi:hypothetical protein
MKMSSYKVSEPSALKFLKANGAVVDENGNVVSDATDYWKKVYDQAEPKPAKYLHADGTIDENPGSGGSGADLEDNHETTIDVSTYTEPVEIEPIEGKDGMKKATVTLENIPSPSADAYIFYYWKNEDMHTGYFTLSENPQVGDNAYMEDDGGGPDRYTAPLKIISVSATSIDVGDGAITRDNARDITYAKS